MMHFDLPANTRPLGRIEEEDEGLEPREGSERMSFVAEHGSQSDWKGDRNSQLSQFTAFLYCLGVHLTQKVPPQSNFQCWSARNQLPASEQCSETDSTILSPDAAEDRATDNLALVPYLEPSTELVPQPDRHYLDTMDRDYEDPRRNTNGGQYGNSQRAYLEQDSAYQKWLDQPVQNRGETFYNNEISGPGATGIIGSVYDRKTAGNQPSNFFHTNRVGAGAFAIIGSAPSSFANNLQRSHTAAVVENTQNRSQPKTLGQSGRTGSMPAENVYGEQMRQQRLAALTRSNNGSSTVTNTIVSETQSVREERERREDTSSFARSGRGHLRR